MLLAVAAVLASGLAGVALLLRQSRRAAAAVAVAGFLAYSLLILLVGPDERLPVGELLLGVPPFVKLWAVAAALALIGLTLVDMLGSGTSAGPAPAMLFLVAGTVALLVPEPGAQIFLASAAGLAALGVFVDAPRAVEGGIRSLAFAGGLIVAGICVATGPLG